MLLLLQRNRRFEVAKHSVSLPYRGHTRITSLKQTRSPRAVGRVVTRQLYVAACERGARAPAATYDLSATPQQPLDFATLCGPDGCRKRPFSQALIAAEKLNLGCTKAYMGPSHTQSETQALEKSNPCRQVACWDRAHTAASSAGGRAHSALVNTPVTLPLQLPHNIHATCLEGTNHQFCCKH